MHRRIRPRFWLFVIGIMLIVFMISGISARRTLRSGAAELAALSEQRAVLNDEKQELSDTYAFVQTDEYVIRTARSELGNADAERSSLCQQQLIRAVFKKSFLFPK